MWGLPTLIALNDAHATTGNTDDAHAKVGIEFQRPDKDNKTCDCRFCRPDLKDRYTKVQ